MQCHLRALGLKYMNNRERRKNHLAFPLLPFRPMAVGSELTRKWDMCEPALLPNGLISFVHPYNTNISTLSIILIFKEKIFPHDGYKFEPPLFQLSIMPQYTTLQDRQTFSCLLLILIHLSHFIVLQVWVWNHP